MIEDAKRGRHGALGDGDGTGESGGEAAGLSAGCAPLRGPDGHARPLAEVEDDAIRHAVRLYAGNLSEAARRLEMGRSTLYRRLRGLGAAD